MLDLNKYEFRTDASLSCGFYYLLKKYQRRYRENRTAYNYELFVSAMRLQMGVVSCEPQFLEEDRLPTPRSVILHEGDGYSDYDGGIIYERNF